MQRRLPLFLAPLLLACFSAQAQDAGPTTARDALLDDLLDQAAAKERLGDYEQAVRLYLELETKLERRRSEKPNDRPTTEVGPGVDRGIGLYLRDRISKLPPEAQERYRLTVDPRAKLALERALASGEPHLGARVDGIPLGAVGALERGGHLTDRRLLHVQPDQLHRARVDRRTLFNHCATDLNLTL